MQRSEYKIKIGDVVRHKTALTDDPSVPETHDSAVAALRFLQELLDSHLLLCGLAPFQTLRMHHNGTAWVVDLEAEVRE